MCKRLNAYVHAERPGRVVAIDGIVFQCDIDHPVSSLLIRPIEELSRRFRGQTAASESVRRGVPLANHAGIRVRIVGPDGRVRPYVVEQQTGTLVQTLENALSWTPWRAFRMREGRGGWDATVPATAFEGIEPPDVARAIDALNQESGRAFYREVCTSFIERIFGGRKLFADVEALDWLVPGPGPHIPEPATPRLKSNAKLSRRARYLLRVDELPAVHSAVGAAQSPEAAGSGAAGEQALSHLSNPKRAPGRVLFWLQAQFANACSTVIARWRNP
jgi:hypothetical protein